MVALHPPLEPVSCPRRPRRRWHLPQLSLPEPPPAQWPLTPLRGGSSWLGLKQNELAAVLDEVIVIVIVIVMTTVAVPLVVGLESLSCLLTYKPILVITGFVTG